LVVRINVNNNRKLNWQTFWTHAIENEKLKGFQIADEHEFILIEPDPESLFKTSRKISIKVKIKGSRWIEWLNDYPYVTLMCRKNNTCRRRELLAGDIDSPEQRIANLVPAKVVEIYPNEREIRLEIRNELNIEQILAFNVILNFSTFPYDQYKECIDVVARNNNQQILLLASRGRIQDINFVELVQGPPGTGKTYDAAKFCSRIFRKNRSKTSYRVLITAHTHQAVRNVIQAFIDWGITDFTTVGINGLPEEIKQEYDLYEKMKRIRGGE
jgi:hypothetical protein